ncbi:MAG: putative ABC transport system permease protein [Cyclobacteriaceae bacterium]|jgi:putative ABC transport system permease protein
MLSNYITIAFRLLKRQIGYTTLNILGFTVGLVASFLILLYLSNELSFDKQHVNAEQIYRISSHISEPDNSFSWAVTQLPLGKTTKAEISEVEQYVRFIGNGRTRFDLDGIFYFEENIFQVDSTVFDVFSYDLIQGNSKTVLQEPNSIVLNETLAKKIFKNEEPIGKILKIDNMTLNVTGIYRDVPTTSHIQPKAMISASSSAHNAQNNWGSFGIYTYILLKEGSDLKSVNTKLQDINDKNVATIFDQFGVKVNYELINVRDIHLTSTFQGEPEVLGNIKYIFIFGAIAIFLILIACINYMNLATARSVKRSREVGVRKVMGANRGGLALQFITESVILTLISFVLSILILILIVPLLNNLLEINLSISNLWQQEIIVIILGILIVTGLISGSYPAFFLSSFKPIVALTGKGSGKASNQTLRRILVGIQFAISIFMLIGTFTIYQQMQYLRNKDLGFDKEKVLKVQLDNQKSREKWPVFKNKLSENHFVSQTSTSSSTPGDGFGKNLTPVETNEGTMEEYGIDLYNIDYDYFTLLDVPIVSGRNISKLYPTDTASAVLINESMVKRMNWDNPLGKKFQIDRDSTKFHTVVGVVKDFHQRSLYNPIEALLFIPALNNGNVMIKVNGKITDAIKSVESDWNEIYPGLPFEYTFLDEAFMDQYKEDQLRGKLFLGFSVVMIFIACLGLLGLASFIAEQRTKEISIRKVLGANAIGLVGLLVKDFLWLVLFGAIPAFVIGYYFMNEWLANFQYHIAISWLVFVIVVLIIGIITVLTTGFHAYRAASANPADNLRYE